MPWAILYGYFVLAGLANGLYRIASVDPTASAVLIHRGAFLVAMSAWLIEYARRQRVALPMDIGLFLYLAALVVVPYYVVRAEGWRRGLRTLGLVALPLVAYLATYVVVVVLGETAE